MEPPAYPLEVSVTEANALMTEHPDQVQILDVREAQELAICRIAEASHLPMRQVAAALAALSRDRHLLVLCHVGQRSRVVTEFLRGQGFAAVSNIAGGIEAWAQEIDPAMARY